MHIKLMQHTSVNSNMQGTRYFVRISECSTYRKLNVQSCKLYNNKYMIASTQITNPEKFAFIAVLFVKLLSRKVLLINRKENRNC